MGIEPSCIDRLLDDRGVLVADGAMGTALFELGLEPGGCPELLNVTDPTAVAAVHRRYLTAGSDLILTNTFGGTRSRLALHGAAHRVAELNTAAVDIARAVTVDLGRPALVAGSIGPTGDLFEPLGPLTAATAADVFGEQCEALAAAGVDVLWVETMSSIEELDAAVDAALATGLPVSGTLSFDTNGSTMMGVSPDRIGRWWTERPVRPAAVGANCGVGPADVVAAAAGIAAAAPGALVVAKGNCGIPLYGSDGLSYEAGPEVMGDYAELAVRAGARIVGACCGSGPKHVARIRERVDRGIAGPVPDLAEIEARLGTVARPAPRARQRRRRPSA